jgi:hypothetical protein
MKKKKIDRPALEGVKRVGFSCRIDPEVLKAAKKACRKKYKLSLSSKIEDFIKNEFPDIFIENQSAPTLLSLHATDYGTVNRSGQLFIFRYDYKLTGVFLPLF